MARTKAGEVKILVVGGGLAGLSAAAFLRQSGRAVVLIERAAKAEPSPGMMLHSNALRVLASLGVEGAVRQRGEVLHGAQILDASGRVLNELPFAEEIARGQRTIGLHTGHLMDLLRGCLDGVDVRAGVSLSNIHLARDHADTFFSDGHHERFALVIGADGLRSRVRELMLGAVSPRDSGAVCRRFLLRRPAEIPPTLTGEQLGAGLRVGWVPLGEGMMYAYFIANQPAEEGDDGASWKERFAAMGGPARALLAAVPTGYPERLQDLWLDTWSKGRMVLLGDAAHAMLPSFAQGSAMAFEDAKALQYCLDHAPETEALAAFEAMRKPRVKAIHEASFDAWKTNQWSSTAAVTFRNLLYRMLSAKASRARLRALIEGGAQVKEILGYRPDLPPITETSLALVRYLIKLSQSDGRFDDDERMFIQASLQEQGEYVAQGELETLSHEQHQRSLAEVLAPYADASQEEREHLLTLGYLVILANGRVAPRERKALEEARLLLGLPMEVLDRIRRDAAG